MREVDVLADECARVSELLLGLPEEEFARPTRCPPWDVKELAAHLWRSLFRIPTILDDGPYDAADTDGVTYWTSYDPDDDSPVIADHARETAREHETGHDLALAFDELWRAACEQAEREDPGRIVRAWWGPRLRLDEFLKTRVLETVVHGLDMTSALGRPTIASRPGLEMVAQTLAALLGGDPPSGWSAVEFIDKGTGRRPLSDSDRALLGAIAARFPLLR